MSGLWIKSFDQLHDLNGKPMPGARAFFYDPSTLAPIIVYQEPSLAVPLPNPVEADGFGIFPGVFVPDEQEFYGFRITTAGGVSIVDVPAVPNLTTTGGGGGGGTPAPVDANALAKTGDLKPRYGTGTHPGWLLCNGRYAGSAASGADYAANGNEALFNYLWQTDTTLDVIGGRGASSAADWSANKRIALPDFRGRVLAGLDGMGNTAAGRLAGLATLGQSVGAASTTLAAGQIPQITGTTDTSGAHTHTMGFQVFTSQGSGEQRLFPGAGTSYVGTTSNNGSHSHNVTAGSANPSAVSLVQPSLGISVYIKI